MATLGRHTCTVCVSVFELVVDVVTVDFGVLDPLDVVDEDVPEAAGAAWDGVVVYANAAVTPLSNSSTAAAVRICVFVEGKFISLRGDHSGASDLMESFQE